MKNMIMFEDNLYEITPKIIHYKSRLRKNSKSLRRDTMFRNLTFGEIESYFSNITLNDVYTMLNNDEYYTMNFMPTIKSRLKLDLINTPTNTIQFRVGRILSNINEYPFIIELGRSMIERYKLLNSTFDEKPSTKYWT
eukprot:UN26182